MCEFTFRSAVNRLAFAFNGIALKQPDQDRISGEIEINVG